MSCFQHAHMDHKKNNRFIKCRTIPKKNLLLMQVPCKSKLRSKSWVFQPPVRNVHFRIIDKLRDLACQIFLLSPHNRGVLFYKLKYYLASRMMFARSFVSTVNPCSRHIWEDLELSPQFSHPRESSLSSSLARGNWPVYLSNKDGAAERYSRNHMWILQCFPQIPLVLYSPPQQGVAPLHKSPH